MKTMSLFTWVPSTTSPQATRTLCQASAEPKGPHPVSDVPPGRGERRLPVEKSWRATAPSRSFALRELMSTGRWHSYEEMRATGGDRFGARLGEIKSGADGGPPIPFEKRSADGGDRLFEYRLKVEELEVDRG